MSEFQRSSAASAAHSSSDEGGSDTEIKVQTSPDAKAHQIQPSDFFFGTTLGEGAFARVVHAKSKTSDAEFAIKIMDKSHIRKENKVKYVLKERKILTMVAHPLIVKFHFSFQDAGYLYMCMDLAKGGELLSLINLKQEENMKRGVCNQACDFITAQFYLAEIVEALQYLHGIGIIHRDLKPENILLDESGHIKITDFGTSLILGEEDEESERNSFVGTQDYVSPEVLSGEKESSKSSDLWALGCMVYQFITGTSPFHAETEYLTFHAISSHCDGSEPLTYPEGMIPVAMSLCQALLVGDETLRLGAGEEDSDNGYAALKAHPFFEGTNWETLSSMEAPFKPDSSKFPSADGMRDGALDDWLFEGDATPIADEKTIVNAPAMTRKISQVIDTQSSARKWEVFLNENEKQIFTSTIYKRKGLFSKKRQLILTDQPRLIYVDPDTMELKGEIPWTIENPVECTKKNEKEFDVLCTASGRAYHLSGRYSTVLHAAHMNDSSSFHLLCLLLTHSLILPHTCEFKTYVCIHLSTI